MFLSIGWQQKITILKRSVILIIRKKRIQWDKDVQGAVGRTSTQGLEGVFDKIEENFGSNKYARRLKQLFQDAYLKHATLTEATRYLANELFRRLWPAYYRWR